MQSLKTSLSNFKTCLLFILIILLLALNTPTLAMPHINGRTEPFKITIGTHLTTRLGKIGATPRALAMAPASYPATIKVLLLRVDFAPDTDALSTGTGAWTDAAYAYSGDPLYTGNPADYWVQKVQARFGAYYSEVSYGLLTATADISTSVYTLPHPVSYYSTTGAQGFENIIKDAVTASAAATNYALYDAIFIVHAGPGAETDIAGDSSHDFWSAYYSATCIDSDPINAGCQPLTANGKIISEAIVVPQNASQDTLNGAPFIVDSLGIYVHEFGHWLGLPDLYNTSLFALTQGVGKWSLMGDGSYLGSPFGSSPGHLDAWSKVYLGWVAPTIITSTTPDPGQKMLTPVESSKSIFKIPISAADPSEYYLLENRQQTLFDTFLPGHGMLVWQISDAVINANMPSNTVNASPTMPGVKLMEADGDFALMKLNAGVGSSGDPYPGATFNTALTPSSNPPSNPYLGSAYVNLKNITESGGNISFILGYGPDITTSLSGSFTCPSTVKLAWTTVTTPDITSYKVYKNGVLLGQTQTTTYNDNAAIAGDAYSISSVDNAGNESGKSSAYTAAACTVISSPSSGSGSSSCFIATAAYGSFESPYVKVLREFRDRFLITNYPGRLFVSTYYRVSPPVASTIEGSETLKFIVRLALLPIIALAALFNATGILAAPLATLVIASIILRRRMKKSLKEIL